jgi:hypothetical protein
VTTTASLVPQIEQNRGGSNSRPQPGQSVVGRPQAEQWTTFSALATDRRLKDLAQHTHGHLQIFEHLEIFIRGATAKVVR